MLSYPAVLKFTWVGLKASVHVVTFLSTWKKLQKMTHTATNILTCICRTVQNSGLYHWYSETSQAMFKTLAIEQKSNLITGLDRPWRFQEVEVSWFQDNRYIKVVRLSALRTGRLNPQGHSAAGRITPMKNSKDNIGNRTRDPPACSTVPLPTALPRTPATERVDCFLFRGQSPGNKSTCCTCWSK